MPRSASKSRAASEPVEDSGYWEVSKRPLQVLFFLLPLVVYYELAMLSVLRADETTYTNLAHRSLLVFFNAFGIHASGWYLPGLALVVVLLVWHILSRQKWTIDVRALGLMVVESAILTLPLLALGQIEARFAATGGLLNLAPQADVGSFGIAAKVAFSIGAGLYEELLFRMALLSLVHILVVDVAKHSHRAGVWAGVIISSVLFMAYHWVGSPPDSISIAQSAFYFVAGLFLGVLYVLRGFGIVVGVHAAYDIVTAAIIGR